MATSDGRIARSESCNATQVIAFLEGHTRPVRCAAFSPDGHYAVTGGGDGLRWWDSETRQQIDHVPIVGSDVPSIPAHTNVISCVAYSPHGQSVISGSDDTTLILWWILPSTVRERSLYLASLRKFVGHGNRVRGVAIVPNRHLIVSGSDDRTVRLWDEETAAEVRRLQRHSGPVTSVAASPDGRLVLSGSEDGTARLWDVETGKELAATALPCPESSAWRSRQMAVMPSLAGLTALSGFGSSLINRTPSVLDGSSEVMPGLSVAFCPFATGRASIRVLPKLESNRSHSAHLLDPGPQGEHDPLLRQGAVRTMTFKRITIAAAVWF